MSAIALLLLLLPFQASAVHCNEFLYTTTSGQWTSAHRRSCGGPCSSYKVTLLDKTWYLGRCGGSITSLCPPRGGKTTKVLRRKDFIEMLGKESVRHLPMNVKEVLLDGFCCQEDYCNDPYINPHVL